MKNSKVVKCTVLVMLVMLVSFYNISSIAANDDIIISISELKYVDVDESLDSEKYDNAMIVVWKLNFIEQIRNTLTYEYMKELLYEINELSNYQYHFDADDVKQFVNKINIYINKHREVIDNLRHRVAKIIYDNFSKEELRYIAKHGDIEMPQHRIIALKKAIFDESENWAMEVAQRAISQ